MARFDSIGLWWEDLPATRKRGDIVRPMPPIPETGWKAPTDFPNLTAAVVKSLDTETYDPELEKSGPGWGRHCGHMVGFSIGAKDSAGNIGQWYVPLAHTVRPEENVPNPEAWLSWLKDQCADETPKIGANFIYDLGWLAETGIKVNGPLYDVQHAEALLDERAHVALDVLAHKYLGEGKVATELYQWCADYYGGQPTGRQRANIWRCPPSLVGPYGEADASLPLRIIEKQWPLLAEEGLLDVFRMECELLPLMLEMRMIGVPVDIEYAERIYEEFGVEVKALNARLKSLVGFELNVNSGADIARAFDKAGIPYGKTAAGNATFTADILEEIDHPLGQLIVDIKQREKLRSVFIKSYLLDNHVNGIVHGTFNQLRGDAGGTRSGRFSSSTPNLQNIPTRSDIGKTIRKAFTAKGQRWLKFDYSQIEYRFLAHFAVDKGDGSADAVRASYCENPDIDYHTYVHDTILRITGLDLSRGHTKNVNFGCIAAGSLVLTNCGLIPIEKVAIWHELWDGFDWVRHDGVVYQGTKDVITYEGLTATSDHEIWTVEDGKCQLGLAAVKKYTLCRYGPITRRIEMPNTPEMEVYDILNAGPRRRFTCSGVLVSNCAYGMGETKLMTRLGLTNKKGKELFNAYHTAAPYVKATMEATMLEAQTYGIIPTIMGRRSRFDLWEPDSWDIKGQALPYDAAVTRYGRVKRAYGHKALNRRLQGSAADMMKKAMWQCWKDGVFAETGVPRLTVHDELDFVDPGGKNEAFKEMQRVMETCMPLKVPVRADREVGPNWGDVAEEKT